MPFTDKESRLSPGIKCGKGIQWTQIPRLSYEKISTSELDLL